MSQSPPTHFHNCLSYQSVSLFFRYIIFNQSLRQSVLNASNHHLIDVTCHGNRINWQLFYSVWFDFSRFFLSFSLRSANNLIFIGFRWSFTHTVIHRVHHWMNEWMICVCIACIDSVNYICSTLSLNALHSPSIDGYIMEQHRVPAIGRIYDKCIHNATFCRRLLHEYIGNGL